MTKFNKTICKEIITLYESGLTKKRCADIVGINRKTITAWYNRGRDCDDEDDPYYQFYMGMLKAKAKFIMYHQDKVSGSDDWRAHKYLLEVTDPDTFVLEKRLNVKADENVDVNIDKESIFDIVRKQLGLDEE